ncbi:unnamed protein product [Callosobruchus maculatus]|uniref:PIN domain-containing protein n=1 Tax=Callosobruchus maculatus TaxID=64391 RepID=A0A653BXR4_CALMS|nr:unnamed protein product [Callosobruchus maculatus]
MPFETREDKLQTRRLTISSSNLTSSCSDLNECQSPRQGTKRTFHRDNSSERNRYLGFSKNIPDSTNPKKNLVNNRLQRLKQALQSESVQSSTQHETRKKCPSPEKSTNNINSSRVHEVSQSVVHNISVPVVSAPSPSVVTAHSPPVVKRSTNIYKHLSQWSTPENHNGKNLANNRLKRLKNYVLNTAHETSNIPTATSGSPKHDDTHEVHNSKHKSPLQRSHEAGTKRRASDSTYDPDTSQPPQKKYIADTQSYPSKSTKDVRDVNNISVKVYSDNNKKGPGGSAASRSLSKRLVKCNSTTKVGTASSDDLNVNRNISPALLNTSASSTYLSDRIRRNSTNSVGDKTPEKGCNMMSPPVLIPKSPANSANISSPCSHRNNHEKQSSNQENTSNIKIISNVVLNKSPYKSTNDDTETPAKVVTSAFKPFTDTLKHDSFIKNPLMSDQDIDSYRGKMAWTASWIEYHTNPDIQKESAVAPVEAVENIDKVAEPVEEMEWSNAEPDEEILPAEPISIKDKPPKLKDICVVVDTNIFISNLSIVKEIASMKPNGNIKPVVYIPWMVIQELDFMKDTCSKNKLKSNIMDSMSFINKRLQEEDPRVIGQTVWEVENQKHIGSSPDDKIISCCMQVSTKYETVILLSNDMNLKNKALINSITACSVQEISSKIDDKLAKNRKFKFMMQKMGILCSSVICECARDTYGTTWNKMHMLTDAPWSFTECLKRINKYWKTVFQDKLMKQCIKTCDDLYKLIKCNRSMSDDSKEFLKFTELCIALCVFFKDIEEYRESVQKTLDDIKKLE